MSVFVIMIHYVCFITYILIVVSAPSTKVTTTKEDLLHYLTQMYTMRRMEITCDTEYKVSDVLLSASVSGLD